MNFLTKSLSIEIENFVSHLKRDCGLIGFKSFTKSAFVQYRKKIQPEVFKKLSDIPRCAKSPDLAQVKSIKQF